jgi:hypothetical protein
LPDAGMQSADGTIVLPGVLAGHPQRSPYGFHAGAGHHQKTAVLRQPDPLVQRQHVGPGWRETGWKPVQPGKGALVKTLPEIRREILAGLQTKISRVTSVGIQQAPGNDLPMIDSTGGSVLSGTMIVVCSWCKKVIGAVPCDLDKDGQKTHGICPACAEKVLAEDEAENHQHKEAA